MGSANETGGRLNQFLEAIEKGAELSDEYWLSTLGISELQLRKVLSPVAESILNIIAYLDSEGLLAKTKAHHFDGIRANGLIAKWQDKKQLDSLTLLKLLVLLIDNFQNNRFFFSRPLIHIPYVFNQVDTFRINFNVTEHCFELYTKYSLSFEGYSSVRLKIEFSCILN